MIPYLVKGGISQTKYRLKYFLLEADVAPPIVNKTSLWDPGYQTIEDESNRWETKARGLIKSAIGPILYKEKVPVPDKEGKDL